MYAVQTLITLIIQLNQLLVQSKGRMIYLNSVQMCILSTFIQSIKHLNLYMVCLVVHLFCF